MKIGLVFDDSLDRNDGVQQYVKTVADWLMRNSHQVRFLVGQTQQAGIYQPYVYSLSRNFSVRANRNRLTIPLPTSRLKIEEVLRKENFDILHVQAPFSPFFGGRVIAQAPKDCAVLATYHIVTAGVFSQLGLRIMRFVQKRALERININLAVSIAAERNAGSYFYRPCHICPNAVDLTRFRSIAAISKKTGFNLVFLGRLVDRKGCGPLLRSLLLLRKRRPDIDWNLQIAGDGPLKSRLMKYVKRSKLSSRVCFLGFIEESHKPQFLASADIAIFPSLYGESFGIVLLEAMASGTITLGGNNPGYQTVLDGSDKSLFNPRQPEELADRLSWLYADFAARKRLLKWQRQRVLRYDIETVGPQLMQYYRQARIEAQACQSASQKG